MTTGDRSNKQGKVQQATVGQPCNGSAYAGRHMPMGQSHDAQGRESSGEIERSHGEHDVICDVRGRDLFWGTELVVDRKTRVPLNVKAVVAA